MNNYLNISNFKIAISILIPLSFVIGSFLVNLLSILIIILFIFSFFKERNYKILNQKYLYLLCLCYLAILLSFLNSEYKSFTFLKTILLLKIIILPVSFQYFFTKNPKKSILVYSSFVVVSILCIDAWIQYFFNVNLIGNIVVSIEDSNRRISGFFGDEKILGSFIKNFSIIALTYFVFIKNKKYRSLFAYFLYLLFFITILITQERSPFLIYFAMGIIIWIYMIRINKKNLILILIPIIFLAILFTQDNILKNRYKSIISTGAGFGVSDKFLDFKKKNVDTKDILQHVKENITIKDSLWGAHFITSINIFKNNKLFGSGPKSYRYECSKNIYDNLDIKYINKRCSTHPHNFIFELLSDIGAIGLIIFFITFFYILINRLKFFFTTKRKSYKLFFFAFIMYNWPLATTGSFFSSQSIFFNSMFLGLIYSYNKENYKDLKNFAGLPQ